MSDNIILNSTYKKSEYLGFRGSINRQLFVPISISKVVHSYAVTFGEIRGFAAVMHHLKVVNCNEHRICLLG